MLEVLPATRVCYGGPEQSARLRICCACSVKPDMLKAAAALASPSWEPVCQTYQSYQSCKHKIRRVIISYGCFESWCLPWSLFLCLSQSGFLIISCLTILSPKLNPLFGPLAWQSSCTILPVLFFSSLRFLQLFPLALLFYFPPQMTHIFKTSLQVFLPTSGSIFL